MRKIKMSKELDQNLKVTDRSNQKNNRINIYNNVIK